MNIKKRGRLNFPLGKQKRLIFVLTLLFIISASLAFAEVSLENLLLSATSPKNLTTDNLNCSYNLDGDSTAAATNWYKNGTSQMVLYMPMEGNETNALLDYSGNGNNGAKSGNLLWNSSGGHDGNGAFNFDGASFIDAGFSMPNASYTKSAWVKFIPGGIDHNIISGNNLGHAFYIRTDGGYRLEAGHNGWFNSVWDPNTFPENVWTLVTLTYDPLVDNGLLILYKNGVEVDREINIPAIVNDTRLLIGASHSPISLFNGSIDDARIYNHALSPEQIAELYNNGGNLIVSSETEVGDEWQCRVTPFNSTEAGATESSNIITINPEPPPNVRISNLLLTASSPNNSTTDNLNCSYNLAGDSTAAATNWYKNGTSQMVLYMPMEGNETNALLDYSGNGNNGDKVGNLVWDDTGGFDGNGAFNFDGASFIDAGFSMSAGAYTKSAWVRFIHGIPSQNIISGNNGGHAFFIINDSGYRLEAGHNGWFNAVFDPNILQENIWTYAALTYDPLVNNGSLILYRNGVEVDREINIPAIASDTRALIGSYSAINLFNGSIDDARIYNHALSAEQIAELYNNGGNIIASSETQVGDEWQCRVTPFSSTEAGATESSNIISILERPIINMAIKLKQGWNLISIPLELIDPILPIPFESIEGNYSHAFAYFAADKKWDSYYAGEPATNKSIDPTIGFWINMTMDDVLEIEGFEAIDPDVELVSGWNLVGYPFLTAKPINETLNVSEINSVLMYNNSNWYSYNPNKPANLNALKQMEPGYGYWVNAE